MKGFNFNEIATQWKREKEKNVKPTSLAAYSLCISNHLSPYFKDKGKPDETEVQSFVDSKLLSGLSIKTVKDIMTVFRMIMGFARSKGYDIPYKFDVTYPKDIGVRKEVDVFSVTQHRCLVDYLTADLSSRNLGILICLNTGLRIGEVCALTWNDIDRVKGEIRINKTLYRIYHGKIDGPHSGLLLSTPKTKHSFRTIPITENLLSLMNALDPNPNRECYLVSNTTKPVEPRSFRNYYRGILRKLQLPELKFHCLRHSFATRCIESECDYKTVSVILGHADITTTLNLYVHPSREQKKQCIEKMLNRLLS